LSPIVEGRVKSGAISPGFRVVIERLLSSSVPQRGILQGRSRLGDWVTGGLGDASRRDCGVVES
jgi:hypothetical protein